MNKLSELEIKEQVEILKNNTKPRFEGEKYTFEEVVQISAKSFFDGAIWAKSVIEKE